MAVALPVAVGVKMYDGQQHPWPGVLLEWKAYRDKRGLLQWWGLVGFAFQSLSSPAQPFAMRLEWLHSSALVGLPESQVYPGREKAPESR